MKKNICIFYGGLSVEHDISIITAIQAMNNIDILKYNIYPIYMRNKCYYLIENYSDISSYVNFKDNKHSEIILQKGILNELKGKKLKKLIKPNCAVICCHGGEGESGILQSILEFNDIPYTSCGAMCSNIGMSKYIQKLAFIGCETSVLPYFYIEKINLNDSIFYNKSLINKYNESLKNNDTQINLLENNIINLANHNEMNIALNSTKDIENKLINIEKRENIYNEMLELFNGKVIVKPNALGSSIGITVANSIEKLKKGIELAFIYDKGVLIEPMLINMEEYNCAAYRKNGNIIISKVERVFKKDEILSFEDKYENDNKSNMVCMNREVFHDDNQITLNIKDITKCVYNRLLFDGMVRIDFLYNKDNSSIYLNEINTIPGSLAFYLFDIEYKEILSDIIEEGIYRFDKEKDKIKMFSNSFLKNKNNIKSKY